MTVMHLAVVGLLWACYDSTMGVWCNSSVGGEGGGEGDVILCFCLQLRFW